MSCASAATVVIVPATPTQVRACSTGTTRSASPSRSRTTSRAAATSALVGGSECRQRSVSRTSRCRPRTRNDGRIPSTTSSRPAAQIDDNERPSSRVQFVGQHRGMTAQPPLMLVITLVIEPAHHGAEYIGRHREEHVTVALRHAWPMSPPCVSGRRRSPCTTRRSPPAQTGCGPTHPVRSGQSRRRPDRALARDASRDARHATRPSSTSAISSRIELVPQSIAARRVVISATPPAPGCRPSTARRQEPPAPRRRTG